MILDSANEMHAREIEFAELEQHPLNEDLGGGGVRSHAIGAGDHDLCAFAPAQGLGR